MKHLSRLTSFIQSLKEPNSFSDIFKYISENIQLSNVLSEILEDEDYLRDVAKMSYNHFNGFYKLVLYSSDAYKLRLHIWLPSNSNIENIHYHRWHFMSKILVGEYKCIDYKLDRNGTEVNKYIYTPRNGSNEYQLIPKGKEKIAIVEEQILKPGDFLVSKPYELHRVIANKNLLTVSLFVQGQDELLSTEVYNEGDVVVNIPSPSLHEDDLVKLIREIQSYI